MPRVTRKTLTDSPTPSRMSPRATTKASTTSSRASRSTADSPSPSPGTSTSRSRSSRSRGAEIRAEPEAVDVVTKPTRGRQQKQGEGDDNVVEKSRSRSRAKAKVEEETEEVAAEPARASGRSRSRGKPVEPDTDTQKEAANNTSSRSRGKAKAEESNKDKAVAESARASRSRVKGPAKTPEEKPVETGRGSRSRSSNNEKAEESTPTNSRSRKGAKQVENTPEEAAETSQPKSRRSRGKAVESKSPEVEADTGRRSRSRGKPVESSVSESVGSSRSSSRSRTPKPAAEEVVEPAVVEDKGRGKSQANGSTRGSRRRSSGKVEDAVPTEDTDMTPPGRRSGRKQVKTEVDQTVPTKKRQSGRKSSTPDNDSETPMDQTDKQAVVQLTKLRDDEVESENKSPAKAADEEAMDEEPVDKEAGSGEVVPDTKEEAVAEVKEEIKSVPEEESTSEDKVPDEPMGEEKDKAETKDETVSKPEKIEEKPVEPKEKVTADIKEAVVTKEKLPVPEDEEIDKVDGDSAAAELPSQKTTLPETEPEPIEIDKSQISEDIVEEKDEKKEESIVEAMETDEVEESPAKKESAPCNGTMPVPEVPADPEQSPEKQNIAVTASHGQKRKLEHDESFEENESKRVCVESPVTQDTESGDMEVSQPDNKAIEEIESRTSQQPIIEPISDVSSAEEESTPAPQVSIQEPVLAEKSLEPPVESKAAPVAECKESPIEISKEPSVEISKEASVEISKEPSVDISKEPSVEISKEASVEISKEPSVEISKEPSVEISKEPAVESKEAVSGETSHKATEGVTKEEQPKPADEDLTSGYVIISMDDVPPTDSAMVKEALPNHTNQTEVKVPDSRSEEESMEVDGVPAVPEQSKVPASAAPALPAVTSDIANGTSQQCSQSDCHPSADSTPVSSQPIDNAKELTKSEPVIPKPVRTFDPSPDIFHRTCVRNPNIDLSSITSSHKFSVASYNILAECHRLKGDYSYTDDKYLEQEFRHQLLLRELEFLDADILCLQEVNPKYYATLLQPALQKRGYDGNLMKRTKEYFDEGEATFVKTSRFSIESSKGVSLADLSKKNINESLNKEVQQAVEEYLDRADVVNISRLRCKQTNKVVTVGNIHVVWDNFSSPDVQSIQIASAVKELVSQAGSDSSPHFLCGDFNSTATSVGYQLARDGYLSDSNIASLQAVENLKLESGSKALINHLWGAFQHTSSNLSSAYNTCQDGEPEFTTYTSNMLEGVDYIFYGSDGLGAADILRVVDSSVLEETGGIPNQDFPSDHLSLKSTLYFK